MLTKEPDLQKWADSILATEPSERAEMVAEDPSVFEVVRKALDSERQTTAKLREAGLKIIEGFDKRFFVRSVDLDKDTGWAIHFAPYLSALAQFAKEQP